MKIVLEPQVAINLESICNQVGRFEFSGVGFCMRTKDALVVYDFELMDIGDTTYTEIKPEKMLELSKRRDARNGRVWVH